MNEEQWLAAAVTRPMLEFLHHRGKASDRQLRLFACACFRAAWNLLTLDWGRQAAEAAEQFLEREISPAAAAKAHARLQEGFGRLNETRERTNAAIHAVAWACLRRSGEGDYDTPNRRGQPAATWPHVGGITAA